MRRRPALGGPVGAGEKQGEPIDSARQIGGEGAIASERRIAMALEEDDLIELRMPIEQPRAPRRDQPADLRRRPAPAEEVEDGQRVNHIADGAGLDQEDALRVALELNHLSSKLE